MELIIYSENNCVTFYTNHPLKNLIESIYQKLSVFKINSSNIQPALFINM